MANYNVIVDFGNSQSATSSIELDSLINDLGLQLTDDDLREFCSEKANLIIGEVIEKASQEYAENLYKIFKKVNGNELKFLPKSSFLRETLKELKASASVSLEEKKELEKTLFSLVKSKATSHN